MKLPESFSTQPLSSIRDAFKEKKGKGPKVYSNEVSENFLSMLQKNIKLNHKNSFHEAFSFLNQQNDALQGNKDAFSSTRSAHQTEGSLYDQNLSPQKPDPSYQPGAENKQREREPFAAEQHAKTEKNQPTSFDKTSPAAEAGGALSSTSRDQMKEEVKPAHVPKEQTKPEKAEHNEKPDPQGRQALKEPASDPKGQGREAQNLDEMLSNLKKNPDAGASKMQKNIEETEAPRIQRNVKEAELSKLPKNAEEVEASLSKKEKENMSLNTSQLRSRSSENKPSVEQAVNARENAQGGQQNSPRVAHLHPNPLEKVAGKTPSKNNGDANPLSVRGEHNFSNIAAYGEKLQGSRFSKLIENPIIKNQLNEQFQSMLNRAKVLIKDQKNASLVTNLHPKELGTVSLKLSMLDGNLNGFFTVDNDAVQKLLTERMDKLLSELRKDGFDVTSFRVNVRSGESSKNGNHTQDQNSARQKGWYTGEANAENRETLDQNVKGGLYA